MEPVKVTAEQLEAARRVLEVLSKVALAESPPPDIPLSEALRLYEDDYVRRNRKSNLLRTMWVVRLFAANIGLEKGVREINRSHLVDFRKKRGETFSPWTANNDLVGVNTSHP